MTSQPLSGARVLVPVTPTRRELADSLRAAGARVDEVQVLAIVPASDRGRLRDAVATWCDGGYDWLAVTSRNAVDALRQEAAAQGRSLNSPQPPAKVAAVGGSTAAACNEIGLSVRFVPARRRSASGMVDEFPAGTGRVLAPLGNLAARTLPEGLSRKGWAVDHVEAYRTVDGPGLSPENLAELRGGEVDAVLLTSGSVAERLASPCADIPLSTMMVAIGETTASSARTAGLRVDAVAATPNHEGIVDTLTSILATKGDR